MRGGEEARAEEVRVERVREVRTRGAGERPDERVVELRAPPDPPRRDQRGLDPRDRPRLAAAAQQLHVSRDAGHLMTSQATARDTNGRLTNMEREKGRWVVI